MKSKNRLFVLLIVIIMGLVSIPKYEPVLQIYDRGVPIRVSDYSKRARREPLQIYDGHLDWMVK